MCGDPQDSMTRALALAARGRGRVEPNPMVGAVVVRDGEIVGEGWHQVFGGPHAEPNAIADAGAEACRGADLYVTLEPCTHHGKTPPCTDAILAAGIARVFVAAIDPFPANQGQGLRILRDAGIEVSTGLLEDSARRLIAPFVKLTTRGLPFLTAKWAMSLDGKTASRTGQSRWISSAPSRKLVHELRGHSDAILIGIGTARSDDPMLTARPPGPRTATRVIVDRRARLPLECKLVQTARDAPVLVATTHAAPVREREALEARGVEVLVLPDRHGRVDLRVLMTELGRRRMTHVLLEGGGELCAAVLSDGLADKLLAFVAPKIIGGRDAPTPVEGEGIGSVGNALLATNWSSRRIGDDLLIEADLDVGWD